MIANVVRELSAALHTFCREERASERERGMMEGDRDSRGKDREAEADRGRPRKCVDGFMEVSSCRQVVRCCSRGKSFASSTCCALSVCRLCVCVCVFGAAVFVRFFSFFSFSFFSFSFFSFFSFLFLFLCLFLFLFLCLCRCLCRCLSVSLSVSLLKDLQRPLFFSSSRFSLTSSSRVPAHRSSVEEATQQRNSQASAL